MAFSTYLSVITLNVNKLNTALKRRMVVEWIKKKKIRPIYILHTVSLHFRCKDTHRLKLKDGKGYPMQIETKRKLG